MRRILIGLVAVLLCGQVWADPVALKVDGNVDDGALTDNLLWVHLYWIDMKFVVDRSKAPNAQAMFDALKDAASQNRFVTIWFDSDTATFDREKWLPTYVLRKAEADGKTFVGDDKTPAHTVPATATPLEQAEDALAHGLALFNGGQGATALPLLDRALAEPGLAPQLRVLALKARAGLREDAALADFAPGEARDRALMAALEDARAWRQAAPDEATAAFQEARILEFLGGYPEAIAIYKDGLLRWPRESARIYRGLEWTYRDMGKLREAAEWVEKLGALPGWKDAMPYRFHRGWLYDLMGLPEAAIAEYTEGLKSQPDYAGTFRRRSCSNAAAGHLKEALDDYTTAQASFARYAEGKPATASSAFDDRRAAEVGKILRQTLAEDPHRKVGGLCDGYWDWGDRPRTRSSLLPATR